MGRAKTWERTLRRLEASGLAVGMALFSPSAQARDSEGAASSHGPEDARPPSACPDPVAVWTHVIELVPSAARQLAPARRSLDIVDAGASYRIHFATPGGVVERTYSDPLRECDKRARFAAEFVVVALMPPTLVDGPSPSSPPSDGPSATEAPGAAPATSTSASIITEPPPPPGPATTIGSRDRSAPRTSRSHGPVQFELSAIATGAPPVSSAVGVFEWGAELRTRLGAGPLEGIGALEVAPKQPFDAGAFRGMLERVPAVVGVRLRAIERPVEIGADLGAVLALEHYQGLSPRIPGEVTRVAPGIEATIDASSPRRSGLAPLFGLRCAWFPGAENLVAPPQIVGRTPSLWLEVALGIVFEP